MKNRNGWLWIFLTLLLFWLLFIPYFSGPKTENASGTVLLEEIKSGKIKRVKTYPEDLHTRVYAGFYAEDKKGVSDKKGIAGISALLAVNGKIAQEIENFSLAGKIVLTHEKQSWLNAGNILTIILIAAVVFSVFWLSRKPGVADKQMSFGKSRAKTAAKEEKTKKTFADVAGCEEAKTNLREVVDYLTTEKLAFEILGAKPPKGIMLYGPPGTGKTLLAKAVAGEANVPFFYISGSDFVEMFVGVGAARVRDLLNQAKSNAPCVVFIDEIDAVGRHRGSGLGGGHDEREQTLNQLLAEMDGFTSSEGVVFMAATNRIDILDPALLRPGRFDLKIYTPLPDLKERFEILKVHIRNKPLEKDVNLEDIAKMTYGFSGADLENLCNEAALLNLREIKSKVKALIEFIKTGGSLDELRCRIAIPHRFFVRAWEKAVSGGEERKLTMSEREKIRVAYHEAGHALVAYVRHILDPQESNPLYKVSIVPRSMALGLTFQLPQEEIHLMTKPAALNKIRVLFGGRVAEEIKLKYVSSGCSDDIKKATALVKKMVLEWGMSNELTPFFLAGSEHVYLGTQIMRSEDRYTGVSEEKVNMVINEILSKAYSKAKITVEKNVKALDALANELLRKETLDKKECEEIFSQNIPAENLRREVYAAKGEEAVS